MAKVLERPRTLYDEDLLAWAEQQAALLEENPSLRPQVETLAVGVYRRPVRLAVIATGLRRSSIPKDLPYDRRAMLGDGDDPDEPVSI